MNITPLIIKENRLNSNPAILILKSKLDLFINDKIKAQEKSLSSFASLAPEGEGAHSLYSLYSERVKENHSPYVEGPYGAELGSKSECWAENNVLLINYANSILSLSIPELANKYGRNVNSPISKYTLPDEWDDLRNYKGVPGIYQFYNEKDSYLGSSKDLFTRCFKQHKNNALTKESIHKKFYSNVVKNTWSSFTLNILEIIPNHIELFVKSNPNYVLTKNEYDFLLDLTLYELTIAEQVYIDVIQPSLNGSFYANWSSYNTGSKGYIRDEESNIKLSLSYLNRSYNQATKNLHSQNRTGTTASDDTRKKMSTSHLSIKKGRSVILFDVKTEKEIVFDTVASLRRELGISDRTINRWALDGKIHQTKSLKYPLIKIKI